MRTAVVRVDVDPSAQLTPAQLTDGMASLRGLAAAAGVEVVDADLAAMPASRREVEVLMAGDRSRRRCKRTAVALCAKAFGTGAEPAGVLTYVSRGTDDDAHGVLAGLRADRRDRTAGPATRAGTSCR